MPMSDLGTWWCMTPFIRRRRRRRAGLDQQLHRPDITNAGLAHSPGLAFGDNVSKWNFAWALHAGVRLQGYAELYRRTRLSLSRHGRRLTGRPPDFRRHPTASSTDTFKSITSNDLKARRALGSLEPAGLSAAADPQGLIAFRFHNEEDGAGLPRAVLLCAARIAFLPADRPANMAGDTNG